MSTPPKAPLAEFAALVARDEEMRATLKPMQERVVAALGGTRFAMRACFHLEPVDLSPQGEWHDAVFEKESDKVGTLYAAESKFAVTLPPGEDEEEDEETSVPSLFEDLWDESVKAAVLGDEDDLDETDTQDFPPTKNDRVALLADPKVRGLYFMETPTPLVDNEDSPRRAVVLWDSMTVATPQLDELRKLTDDESDLEDDPKADVFVTSVLCSNNAPQMVLLGPRTHTHEQWISYKSCAAMPECEDIRIVPPPFMLNGQTVPGGDTACWATVQLPVVTFPVFGTERDKVATPVSEFSAQIVAPCHGLSWNSTSGKWEFHRYMLLLEKDMGPVLARLHNLTLLADRPDGMAE